MVREGAHEAVNVMSQPTLAGWISHTKDLLQATCTETEGFWHTKNAERFLVQPSNPDNAYNLNLDNGQVNNDDKNNDNNNRARCVREHIFTFKEVYDAYLACRKQKRNTINALKFEQDLECNMGRLVYELNSRTYYPARSVCFTILKPKPREIFAADFRDRIVHHLLFNYLNPICEKKFIYDSFACRKNKGTLAATKRLQTQTRKVTNNNQHHAFYLQLDIHNFFMSIDKEILFQLIQKHLKDKTYYWLAKKLIFHDPTKEYINKTPKELKHKVPEHKSLPNQKQHTGLPIGNLTSQFFANVYLNELDQYVKHTLKAKQYIRYVDDFVLLHENKNILHKWKVQIEHFLQTKLHLKLKPLIKIQPISNGINFVGCIIRPTYLLPRNRNVHTVKQTIQKQYSLCLQQHETYRSYSYEPIQVLIKSLNSHLGYFRHHSHKIILQRIKQHFPFLQLFLNFHSYSVSSYWNNSLTNFNKQNSFFNRITKPHMLCIQVGKYFRIVDNSALFMAKLCKKSFLETKSYTYIDLPKSTILHYMSVILQSYTFCVFVVQRKVNSIIYRELDSLCTKKLL